jgi:glycosyltransferase involved in cell wall biosynthesis
MEAKIAFVVSTLNSGGIENYLLRFLNYYKQELNAVVFCKNGVQGELADKYKALGVEIIAYPMGYFSIPSWRRFYSDMKRYKFEAVCDFTGNFAGIPLYIAQLAGINKRIAFYRGSTNRFSEDKFRLLYNKLVRALVKKHATKILSNSRAALDFFYLERKEYDTKYEVIYNGIDASAFINSGNLRQELSIPENAYVIGHVGRLHYSKNHETALAVAIALCERYPDIYFLFTGKGVDEHYGGLVSEKGLKERIKLLGYRADVSAVLNTMNAYYFPSVTEGQPNALIEAMICDLPFVASNIDPIKECVPERLYGQLCDPMDQESAIMKLEALYRDKNAAAQLSCAAWAKSYYAPDKLFKAFKDNL